MLSAVEMRRAFFVVRKGYSLEQKQKQKRFDAGAFTNRQIELRARAALKERSRQGEYEDPLKKKELLEAEIKVQAKLHKEERTLLRQQRTLERQAKSAAAKAQADARMERDIAWGEEHKDDSDAELIVYVKDCAASLGRTPYVKEVLGGEYIRNRFVSWSIVLQEAGLPLPADMKPPTKKMLAAYRELKKEPLKL